MIEALVTLMLLSLLAGVVFPNMSRWYSATVSRQRLAELSAELQQLSAAAVFLGLDFSIADAARGADAAGSPGVLPPPYRLNMANGWRVLSAGNARFFRTGLCQPGQALLSDGAQIVSVTLSRLCDLQMAPVAAGAA